MRIEQGFVAVTPDGEYLQWWRRQTHVGHHIEFKTTVSIDHASFSNIAHERGFGLQRGDSAPPHAWVPAERRTEVVLSAWGVE